MALKLPDLQPRGRQLGQQPHGAPQAVSRGCLPGPGTWAGTLAGQATQETPFLAQHLGHIHDADGLTTPAWKLSAPRAGERKWG